MQARPTQEVRTPASVVVPASTGVTPASAVLQRPAWQLRPVQQSLALVQVTSATPQLARQRNAGAVGVPRQFGYAEQQPPLT